MIDYGEIEPMDIDGYDACKILEQIVSAYAIPQISSDYVYTKVKSILVKKKLLKERDTE